MKTLRFRQPETAREAAAQFCYHSLEENAGAQTSAFQESWILYFDERDRRFALALAYGTLSKLYTIDQILNHHGRRRVDDLHPWLRTVLRLAIWQLRWSKVPAAAVVDTACDLVARYLHRGAVSYTNAILRKELREPYQWKEKDLAMTYSLPPELAGCFKKWFGLEEARRQLEAFEEVPPLTLRINTTKTDKPSLKKRLALEGCLVEEPSFHPEALHLRLQGRVLTQLPSFQEGDFFLQGESAMLTGSLARDLFEQRIVSKTGKPWKELSMEEKRCYRIADVCAAPGGKITHLMEALGEGPHYIAQDSLEERLERVEENRSRLAAFGSPSATTRCAEPLCSRRTGDNGPGSL